MSVVRESQGMKPLAMFFILAYGISWACWLSAAVVASIAGSMQGLEPLLYFGILGPALSALIIKGREGGRSAVRELVASSIKWQVKAPWLLASFLVPAALYISAIGLNLLLGGPSPIIYSSHWLDLTLLFLYSVFLSGGLEEPGWRGYALPKLQTKYSATMSTLVLAVLWAFWHLPLLAIPGYAESQGSFIGLLLMAVPLAFFFTWLYNNTESVFVCIIGHSSINYLANILIVSSSDQQFGFLYLGFLWLTAIILLAVFKRERLARERAPNE